MRADANIFLIICLLFLAGTATAASTISKTSGDWIIANGEDQFNVVVDVRYANNTPVNGATVVFTVNNTVFGTLSPSPVTTGANGLATTTFTAGTRSGTVMITATASYDDVTGHVNEVMSITQDIDHDTLIATFSPVSGHVNQIINLNVSIADQWGNPIDTRRYADTTVSLSVSDANLNDCEFVGNGHSFSAEPDVHGNLIAPLKLGTKTGITAVVMSPVQNLDQQVAFIQTLHSNTVSLSVELSPGPTIVVGSGILNFNYTLEDEFGNPIPDETLHIQTSLGEQCWTTTNTLGKSPIMSYGPKNNADVIVINASVVNWTPSLINEFTVTFKNAEPTMSLFVSPTSMGSLDYVPPTKSVVIVRVRDDMGNPLPGEVISFAISGYTPGAWVSDPSLSSYSETTDEYGTVQIEFYPAEFAPGTSETGTCLLTATWAAEPSVSPKSQTMTFSNIPYLNVYTNVSPTTVQIGEEIDVYIRIAVNGRPIINHNITVMMNQDTSSSMGNPDNKTVVPTKDRIDVASDCGQLFITQMPPWPRTQMGMETFGKAQKAPAQDRIDIGNPTNVYNNFPLLTGSGSSQEMEPSMYRSLNQIYEHTGAGSGREGDIKVMILLSDGGQNFDYETISTLAKTNGNNTYVFPILYSDGTSNTSLVQKSMEELAERTEGKFYKSGNEEELILAFQDIIAQIALLAGDDTTMSISFDNIQINKTYTVADGEDLYNYTPVNIPTGLLPGEISGASSTDLSGSRTSIGWPNGTMSVVNQSEQWPNLQFSVGAITLGKEWNTTFRLQVKQLGCYNVFGGTSVIEYGGGLLTTTLPDLPICVNKSVVSGAFSGATLDLSNLQTGAGPFTEFVPLTWDTLYSTTTPTNSVTEYLYYSVNGGIEKRFDLRTISGVEATAAPGNTVSRNAKLDIRSLPSGNHLIHIRIYGVSTEGVEDELVWDQLVQKQYYPPYIKLE